MDVVRTASFERRVSELSDREAVIRMDVAAQRMRRGNFGDWKNVGHGVRETRIHYGPEYRIYWTLRAQKLSFCCCVETSEVNLATSRSQSFFLKHSGWRSEWRSNSIPSMLRVISRPRKTSRFI